MGECKHGPRELQTFRLSRPFKFLNMLKFKVHTFEHPGLAKLKAKQFGLRHHKFESLKPLELESRVRCLSLRVSEFESWKVSS